MSWCLRGSKKLVNSFGCQPAFGVEGGHAAGAGGGDCLAVVVVGHVAGGEYAFDARVAVRNGCVHLM